MAPIPLAQQLIDTQASRVVLGVDASCKATT